ncbi:DUF2470 domain-containing protein [Paenibacillus sp. TRM 82003]|uniref:DUF2470 domain-containing protein n=1 Tax=Kineococcus sp. TRM81007 TaxID=2925831 RepID=UPI001F5A7B8C|nr:DUF2470 domain-containing protein [Kineococcus sp. TRM81007]MCI2239126.1 DUF2470 domain-containing protein [Kineococcus sp. TRM81007]MCI3924806.1 DUF2470 domain-containing protein [Paenibacillus sp. TRM 82003]
MTRWTTAPGEHSERTGSNSTACGQVPPTPPPLPRRTTPAQWARTLAEGTVPGTLHLPRTGTAGTCPHHGPAGHATGARAGRTDQHRVRHLTDAAGGLLLLVGTDEPLHERLRELTAEAAGAPGASGLPVVLDVLDVPPGQAALPRARLCTTGWVQALDARAQREAAQSAAAVHPLGALLDVGSTRTLWRLEVGEVRVTTSEGVHLLDEDAVAVATADPFYPDEDGAVTHLETEHRDALVGWVLRELPPEEAVRTREVSVVGLDRYGLDVLVTADTGTRVLRASYARPASGPHELRAALCSALGCPCGGLEV